MANWITHMMIADKLLEMIHGLDRTGFCVGNIAPDCNIENEDWSAFTPSREVTHWMSGEKKTAVDCERFYECRIAERVFESEQERSFYLGYYAHLVTDAVFQRFIRDEKRVESMMERIHLHADTAERMRELPQDFDGVKMAFGKRERMRDIEQIEYEYLRENPQSGYLTVLRTLREFPDYPEYLPEGAIMRKIGVMAVLPEKIDDAEFVFFSREEYRDFLNETVETLRKCLDR